MPLRRSGRPRPRRVVAGVRGARHPRRRVARRDAPPALGVDVRRPPGGGGRTGGRPRAVHPLRRPDPGARTAPAPAALEARRCLEPEPPVDPHHPARPPGGVGRGPRPGRAVAAGDPPSRPPRGGGDEPGAGLVRPGSRRRGARPGRRHARGHGVGGGLGPGRCVRQDRGGRGDGTAGGDGRRGAGAGGRRGAARRRRPLVAPHPRRPAPLPGGGGGRRPAGRPRGGRLPDRRGGPQHGRLRRGRQRPAGVLPRRRLVPDRPGGAPAPPTRSSTPPCRWPGRPA